MRAYEFNPDTKEIPGLDLHRVRGVVSLAGFSSEVLDNLGPALSYRDKPDRIIECIEEIDSTSRTLYIAEDFIDGVEQAVASSSEPIAEQRVVTHRNMLKTHKKIYAGTNGGADWYAITGDSDAIDRATESLSTLDLGSICSRSWVDLLLGTEDEAEIINAPFFEEHIGLLGAQAISVRNLIPEQFMEIAHAQAHGRRIMISEAGKPGVFPATESAVRVMLREIEQASWLDDRLQRRIDREASRLRDSLIRVRTKPDEVYAEGMVRSYKNVIDELIKGFVDVTVAEAHNEYFTPTTKKQKRNKRLAEYTQRQAEIDGPLDLISDEEPAEIVQPTVEACGKNDTRLEHYGSVELEFPWITDISEYPVQVLRGNDRNIYVVNAQEPKIAAISNEVKTGLPKNDAGLDVFDISIMHRANSLAAGIMPHLDPSVRRIRNKQSDLREAYKKTTIWYPFDISPNAPRLYYTVKPAPKTLGEDVDAEDLLLIVLAETDKAHQIDVLKRFTTKSHKALVQQGAGSV